VAVSAVPESTEDIFKYSEFVQLQGAEKIPPRRIWAICKQEIFSATQQLG
jgi:hypothetical protein